MKARDTLNESTGYDRRDFIQTGLKIAVASAFSIGIVSCKNEEGQKVSPPEDLMQEHGLLNRILLIYDTCTQQLIKKQPFTAEHLSAAATILRTFVEDYHEKQEEQFIFPRFEKAHQQVELVKVLYKQHEAGRRLTEQILQICKSQRPSDSENQQLIRALTSFNTMYCPHEAREDTILFPAFRKIVSTHEYDSLGEDFENNERKKFGEDGFEKMVEKIAAIEKSLNIYDLDQFTPAV